MLGRVNYDLANWVGLVSQLHGDLERVPEKSRLQLLLDSELFLQDTQEGTVIFYDLLNYLKSRGLPLQRLLFADEDGCSLQTSGAWRCC